MLSFVFYYLLRHPEAYRKAQQEVDEVVGRESVRPEHLNKLPYITAVLRETARLQSTAPAFTLAPRSEHGELLGGKYYIGPDEAVIAVLHNVHRDPAVYGPDAEEFIPERMLDENFEKLPPNSWKPFGNGARGCIGAWTIVPDSLFTTPANDRNRSAFCLARDDACYGNALAIL